MCFVCHASLLHPSWKLTYSHIAWTFAADAAAAAVGKDDKSFAMYIDGHRSWFQHNSLHERRVEGGITTGSRVGVLLDLDRHTLSFLVNDMPQGSVAFRDLYGVFYPAVSLSRGVVVKLHSAIEAPTINY